MFKFDIAVKTEARFKKLPESRLSHTGDICAPFCRSAPWPGDPSIGTCVKTSYHSIRIYI